MEKKVDQIRNIECQVSDERYRKLIIQLEESRSREAALKEELKRLKEDLKCELEKKNVIIEEMEQQNERVLMEKNGDINRLENDLKSIMSNRVNINVPDIKVEGPADDELHQDVFLFH